MITRVGHRVVVVSVSLVLLAVLLVSVFLGMRWF
jgi:hypothetical protein